MKKLTLSWRKFLSYRNQSIDLQSKSMDWFLYGRNLRHEKVNYIELYWTVEMRIVSNLYIYSNYTLSLMTFRSLKYLKFILIFRNNEGFKFGWKYYMIMKLNFAIYIVKWWDFKILAYERGIQMNNVVIARIYSCSVIKYFKRYFQQEHTPYTLARYQKGTWDYK